MRIRLWLHSPNSSGSYVLSIRSNETAPVYQGLFHLSATVCRLDPFRQCCGFTQIGVRAECLQALFFRSGNVQCIDECAQ